jgi:phage terminase small subunit
MEIVQKGGSLLESEEAFFEWLNKDSNIEDLLKSTLAFLDYKKQTADKLVKETYKELDDFWVTNVVTRVKTQQAVTDSFNQAIKKIDPKSKDYLDIFSTGSKIERETKGVSDEVTQVNKLVAGINQTQQLKTLYEKQRVYICQTYFAKKSKPDEYKKALDLKRQSIRKVVNQFIEAFTGDSNRRHRLYI